MPGRRVLGVARLPRGALLIAVLGTACGGGEPAGEDSVNEVVGRAPAAVGDVPSVIMLTPVSAPAPARADRVVMDQFTMSFAPRLLIAPAGGTVRFTNSEQVAHNVTVRARGSDSPLLNTDLDFEGHAELRLDEAGPYDVSCNTHPGMAAFIFATRAPYASFAEVDGSFRLEDVPPGAYVLEVWSAEPGQRSEQTLDVVPGRTEVTLSAGG